MTDPARPPDPARSPNRSRRRVVAKPALRARRGVVVAQNREAARVGAAVLAEGGSAADAAVATALALGVLEPWMSGLGGVGGMLLHDAASGRVEAIDFGPRSPDALDPADYPLAGEGADGGLFGWPRVVGDRNVVGAGSAAVPSQAFGLGAAHARHGRLPWARLVEPAAALAEAGPVVDWFTTLMTATALADLARDPGCAATFLRAGGPPVPPLSGPALRLPMPALARTLRALAAEGAEAMARGPLAQGIAAEVAALGGCLSAADLAAYRPRIAQAHAFDYHGRRIHVLPELNGGPTLVFAFADMAKWRPEPETHPDAATYLAYARSLKAAFADRFLRLGDGGESGAPTCTTHVSVADRDGNLVALTTTLLSGFGARAMLPSSGLLLNNGLNWFDPRPGGPNGLGPGRRALANYCPAIVLGGGESVALGAAGGRRIIPAVFQLLAFIADFGLDLDRAFREPRIDVSGAGPVGLDASLPPEVREAVAAHYATSEHEPAEYPHPFAVANGVRRVGDLNEGAADPHHPWAEAVSEDEA